jgi:hypothetical protein
MKDPAKTAVIERFRRIATEYQKIVDSIQGHNAAIAELHEKLNSLNPIAQDCYAAARLFGFDLAAEAAVMADDGEKVSPLLETSPPAHPKGKTIRELVLEEAEKAFPEAVRASPLRLKLEHMRGEKLHEKTIGMTLYRLLKDGFLRRDKRDWYFVPPDKRDKETTKKPA